MISVSTSSSDWPTNDNLNQIMEEHVKTVAGTIFRTAVKLSPVRTGAFRASWRVSFNSARDDVTAGRSVQFPIRGASFRWPKGFKIGDAVVISNNQEYAEMLEYGSSKQAPFGVLRVAVALAQIY